MSVAVLVIERGEERGVGGEGEGEKKDERKRGR